MSNKTQLTAQQRAQLFAMSTRQNLQMLAKETANTTPKTLTFTLPKARLLSSLMIKVKGHLDVTGSVTDSDIWEIVSTNIYKTIRRISLDLNNGFAPFVVSGMECALYNLVSANSHLYTIKYNPNKGGADNTTPGYTEIDSSGRDFEFVLPLQVALNQRDPIGLILLQNDQTNVTLSVDIGTASEIVEGFNKVTSAELSNVTIMPMIETFSIPANANAYPDLSVLKLVNGRKDSLATAGQQIIKLTTGTIYRKLIFRICDEDGNPVEDDFITSDIQLVFNQADINYSVNPEMLRAWNIREFGHALPKGVYVFDFSTAGGCVDLGGSRDYIDTANLTEFWLRFNTTGRGKVEIVTETLARLG